MASAICAWRNQFKVLQNVGSSYGRCSRLAERSSERVQLPAIVSKRPDAAALRYLPGKKSFRELLDRETSTVARSFALEPSPRFQEQLWLILFGLPNNTQEMHFFNGEVGQLDQTAPLDLKYELFGFCLCFEKASTPFAVFRQSHVPKPDNIPLAYINALPLTGSALLFFQGFLGRFAFFGLFLGYLSRLVSSQPSRLAQPL
jgi:hypothetical protein